MTTDTRATHTPGPWKVYDENKNASVGTMMAIQTREKYPQTIADIRLKSIDTLPAEANARLIAAAPDLLAALEEVSKWMYKAIADDAFANCVLPHAPETLMQHVAEIVNKAKGQ